MQIKTAVLNTIHSIVVYNVLERSNVDFFWFTENTQCVCMCVYCMCVRECVSVCQCVFSMSACVCVCV